MTNKKHRKNGEGTLFKRKDGRWQASFIPENGKRKYVYGTSKEEALKKLRDAQQEDKKGILATGPNQKLGEYLIQWLESTHRPPMVRHMTYVQYRSIINKHLVPSLGHVLLQKLTVQQIQAFYTRKLQEGLSSSTITAIHGVLHGALENAVKWNLVSRNIASLVTVPRKTSPEMKVLSIGDAQKLMQEIKSTWMEAIILLALTTGMRRGEMLGLRWNDIDLDQSVLYVRRTMNRVPGFGFIENEPKTRSGKRRVMLPNIVVETLKQHHERQDQEKENAGNTWIEKGLVFPSGTGNFLNPNRLLKRFHRALNKANLPDVRFHDLRHSAATILLSMGIHPKVVQELLGHSNISMTMDTYSHLLPSMQKDAMSGMDKLFNHDTDVNPDVKEEE